MSVSKLGRKKEHRERTLRNLVTSLVLHEKVRTTEAKAKAILPLAERLFTKAKDGDLAGRRSAKSVLFDNNAVAKLMEDMSTRRGDRSSGFIRLTKIAPRPGDGAAMAQLEVLLTPLDKILEEQTKTTVKVRKNKVATAETPTEQAEKEESV